MFGFNGVCHVLRVSSVLNRDVKEYGKKFMFDGNDETCWNSDQVPITVYTCTTSFRGVGEDVCCSHVATLPHLLQGSPQYVMIEFPFPVSVSKVEIKFQGGFAATDCVLMAGSVEEEMEPLQYFYPRDINSLQVYLVTRIKTAITAMYN